MGLQRGQRRPHLERAAPSGAARRRANQSAITAALAAPTGQFVRMPPIIERVEPVLNVRDVLSLHHVLCPLGFTERFRDHPESPRFVIVDRDNAVLALQWHDFVGIAGDRPTLPFPIDDVDGLSAEFGDFPTEPLSPTRLGAPASSTYAMATAMCCSFTATCSARSRVSARRTAAGIAQGMRACKAHGAPLGRRCGELQHGE